MNTQRWMITTMFVLAAPLGLLGCDGDEGDSNDEAAGDESTGGETDGGETLGRTDADASSGGDFGGDLGMDSGSESGEPTGCAAKQTQDECNIEPGCAAVLGNAIMADGEGGWCSAVEDQYIGCVETGSLCPPLTKVLCGGDQIWTTTDCVPDTLMVCDPPGDISGPCP